MTPQDIYILYLYLQSYLFGHPDPGAPTNYFSMVILRV